MEIKRADPGGGPRVRKALLSGGAKRLLRGLSRPGNLVWLFTRLAPAPILVASRVPHRLRLALRYALRPLKQVPRWLIASREETNFTYNLHSIDLVHIAHVVAVATECAPAEALRYIKEAESNEALKGHVARMVRGRGAKSVDALTTDKEPRFGRRLGWYAIARALKPRFIVETGLDKGLGSLILCAALLRNAGEGAPGRYLGIDILPGTGWLLAGDYATVGTIVYADAVTALNALETKIDLFVNDSDHAPNYEGREYEMICDKLSDRAVIVGDNAHSTTVLAEFSEREGRGFVFFREKPIDHWYPGAGIGVSFPLRR